MLLAEELLDVVEIELVELEELETEELETELDVLLLEEEVTTADIVTEQSRIYGVPTVPNSP